MKAKISLSLAVLALLLVAWTPAIAEDTVLRVLAVQTDDVEGYVKQVEQGKAILKKAGSPGIVRVWRADLAGSDTGSIAVSIEYENLQAFAADMARLADSVEYQTWRKGLAKTRTIVSDSLYSEL